MTVERGVAEEFLEQAIRILTPSDKLLLYLIAERRSVRVTELFRAYQEAAPKLGLPTATMRDVIRWLYGLRLAGFISMRREGFSKKIKSVKVHPSIDPQALKEVLAKTLGMA